MIFDTHQIREVAALIAERDKLRAELADRDAEAQDLRAEVERLRGQHSCTTSQSEVDRINREFEALPTDRCFITWKAHGPHDWWHTTSGGGHMLGGPDPSERNVTKHHCPGTGAGALP